MGIYIPNVSKPKSCRECLAHSFTFGDEYVLAHDSCGALKKWFNVKKIDIDPFKEILPDCLIIEIPQEDEEAVLFLVRMRKAMREGKSLKEFLDGERANNTQTAELL